MLSSIPGMAPITVRLGADCLPFARLGGIKDEVYNEGTHFAVRPKISVS